MLLAGAMVGRLLIAPVPNSALLRMLAERLHNLSQSSQLLNIQLPATTSMAKETQLGARRHFGTRIL